MGLFFTLWGLALAAHALAPPRGGARGCRTCSRSAVQTQAAHFARAARSVDSNWLTQFRGHEHLRLDSLGKARFHGLDGLTAPSDELLRAMLRAPCVTVQCSTPGLRREGAPRPAAPSTRPRARRRRSRATTSRRSAAAAPAAAAAKTFPADYLSSMAKPPAAASNASAAAAPGAAALPGGDYLASMSPAAAPAAAPEAAKKPFPADYLSSMTPAAPPAVAPAKGLPADYLRR